MTKLSDTQLLLLASAAKRDDRGIVLPDRLAVGARDTVVNRLLALPLIERVEPAPNAPRPLGNSEPSVTLRITDAGLAAIGVETDDDIARPKEAASQSDTGEREPAGRQENEGREAPEAADPGDGARDASDPPDGSAYMLRTAAGPDQGFAPTGTAPAPVPQRSGKLAIVLDLLRRPEGASLDELVAATGWQRHSVRGVIAGSVRRKLGHTVVSEKQDGVRSYRIEG